jgi:hypothetical protein
VRATCSCVTTSTGLAFRGVPTVQRTLHRTTAHSVSAATYSSVLRTTYYVLMNPADQLALLGSCQCQRHLLQQAVPPVHVCSPESP